MKPLTLNSMPDVSKSPRVGSRDRMLELMEDVLAEEGREHQLHQADPATLVDVIDGRPSHRYRVYEPSFGENVVVGQLTESHFKGMVRSALMDFMKRIHESQPGEWRIVAVSAAEGFRNKWQRVPTGRQASLAVPLGEDGLPMQHNPQSTRRVLGKDPRIVLRCAIAEVSGAPPVDHLFERTGQRGGRHFNYAESRGLLKYMPRTLRDDRKKALEIIAEHYDFNVDAVEPDLTEEQIERIAKMYSIQMSVEDMAGVLNCSVEKVEGNLPKTKPKPAPKGKRLTKEASP